MFRAPGGSAAARGRWCWASHGVVYCLDDAVYDIIFEIGEYISFCALDNFFDRGDLPITCLETLTSMSSSRAGLCVAGSTRLAWWMEDEEDPEDVEDAGDDIPE
jgi:hypothetical protein